MTCNYGSWRHQRHDAVAHMMVGPCEAAGASALREFPVSEFVGSDGLDEILDVRSTGSVWATDRTLDVTVWHSCAATMVQAVARTDGAAAAKGEEDKQMRYPKVFAMRVVLVKPVAGGVGV